MGYNLHMIKTSVATPDLESIHIYYYVQIRSVITVTIFY